ncbi:Anthranilate 1,2-dioxygenase system ferredoxin--NAD(+) reductase component [Paraburkholderia unamae]|uniref:NAD(P)/FAD-dependent oxidoreductase n=1 Tax=Paraburkholderia unamae TaxID=219649 RepID=UPI001CAFC3DE|nr:FAD-dependent oxidoreductase [Paraburkholderia unamae]CAG9275150.1 Anthranilate 1,2-dioxygenase system ferredoxin--NAD(+) reductase component [Paraburkholderia unamae]
MKPGEAMVVVGGGQCGARAVQVLREGGWAGAITLIAEEAELPYERPPLSKAVLLGERTPAQGAIHSEAFYREQGVDLRSGCQAKAIDRAAHTVTLANGETLAYRRLLIATGAQPRRMQVPGADLAGVHMLRDAGDALAMAAEFAPGRRIAVIGAGFIGLEVAASAVQRGCEVVVLEAAPRALMRAVPAEVAQCLVAHHRERGVDVRLNVQVERLEGEGRVRAVVLADGSVVPCDAAVVGVGVAPRVALAQEAGLEIDNGIAVDPTLRTSDADIYAAGDVCSFVHPLYGRRMRLECWRNAEDQARTAALNMLGHDETHSAVPWFWSDQYDMTIQIAGLPAFGTTTVVRETGAASKVFFALNGVGELVSASGVGQTGEIARDVRIAQALIARRARIDPACLADRATKLKALLAQQA